ncbi:hypothetical protein BBP40_002302 [Aspergillus hancockii]|nr:hypothetical protein BBP40_002302 [Aspergillus hancockii]
MAFSTPTRPAAALAALSEHPRSSSTDTDEQQSVTYQTPNSCFPDEDDENDLPTADRSPTPATRRATASSGPVRRQAREPPRQEALRRSPRTNRTIQAYLSQVTDDELHRNTQRALLESCSPKADPPSPAPSQRRANYASPMRPAGIPIDAVYIELSDDELDQTLSTPPSRAHPKSSIFPDPNAHNETENAEDAGGSLVQSTEGRPAESSEDETEGPGSPFSVSAQPDTPGTEISDDGFEDRDVILNCISAPISTEDIILEVRNEIRKAKDGKDKPLKEGHAYVFRQSPTQPQLYKIGHSIQVKKRQNRHRKRCKLPDWEAKKSPAWPIREYKRLERLAQAELANLACQPNCACFIKHKEYFWGDPSVGTNVLAFWSRWLQEQEPYDEKGELKPFWDDRVELFVRKEHRIHFNCPARCTERHPGSPACQNCIRLGWEKFANPTIQEVFEYSCRMHIPYPSARWMLQTCHRSFPFSENGLNKVVNFIGATRRICPLLSGTSCILLLRGLVSFVWIMCTRSMQLSALLDIFLAVRIVYKLFFLAEYKSDISRKQSNLASRAPRETLENDPSANSEPPTTPETTAGQSKRASRRESKELTSEDPIDMQRYNELRAPVENTAKR